MTAFDRFLEAMAHRWVVERYSLDEEDRLHVHYRSVTDPDLTWSHRPYNPLETIPKVGTVGMIGFVAKEEHVESAPNTKDLAE